MTDLKHFLDIADFDLATLRAMLEHAKLLKEKTKQGDLDRPLRGKQMAMVFEKPSTRTKVSFEIGMNHLGGNSVVLDSKSSQIGRGETTADTARVLSRYVDIIMLRCFKHDTLKEMAEYANVPVINGLTDFSHPCQIMADIMTFEEHRGDIAGKTVAWVGDVNNVANTWLQAAPIFGFKLRVACPPEFAPPNDAPDWVTITDNPLEAAEGADLVSTDTWVSMGDEEGEEQKRELLPPFQVTDEVMNAAKDDALFMHCLPAHRGEEVTDSVMDGQHSAVWDEAENRLHAQKAIILWCLGKL